MKKIDNVKFVLWCVFCVVIGVVILPFTTPFILIKYLVGVVSYLTDARTSYYKKLLEIEQNKGVKR